MQLTKAYLLALLSTAVVAQEEILRIKRQDWASVVASAASYGASVAQSAAGTASTAAAPYDKRQDWQSIAASAASYGASVAQSASNVAATAGASYEMENSESWEETVASAASYAASVAQSAAEVAATAGRKRQDWQSAVNSAEVCSTSFNFVDAMFRSGTAFANLQVCSPLRPQLEAPTRLMELRLPAQQLHMVLPLLLLPKA